MPQLQINQGPQDALLYDNTRSYFTNVGYVRTSNFQMELRDVPPQNNAALGSTVHYVIPKSADLLGPVDLLVDFHDATPAAGASATVTGGATGTAVGNYASWVESLGFAMIDEMQFSIGSHVVETISGDQMNIINELMKGDTQRQGKNIGKTGRSGIVLDVNEATIVAANGTAGNPAYAVHTTDKRNIVTGATGSTGRSLIIPLNFFFTKHPSQYFPLCAIAGCNDVRVTIKFRSLNELMIIGRHNYLTATSGNTALTKAAQVDVTAEQVGVSSAVSAVPVFAQSSGLKKAELRCHYIHVTGPEATTLMNKEHVRLLKLWHHQPHTFTVKAGAVSTAAVPVAPTKGRFSMDLSFLHPVQELIITVRKTSNMTSSLELPLKVNDTDQKATCKNYFAYEGSGKDPNIESHLNKVPQRAHGIEPLSAPCVNTLTVTDFKLSLNGQERHPSLASSGISRDYLMDRIMPMLHSNTSDNFIEAGITDPGFDASATFAHLGEMLDRKEIYVYPFALNPEGANPSGAVNFSKVSHAKLDIGYLAERFDGGAAGDSEEYVVDVYGVYFNWLQIKDGRALTSFQ